jgi:hypothetical protein
VDNDHRTQCQITFKAENEGWKLVLRFEYLDIPDKTGKICNDAIYVFDSNGIIDLSCEYTVAPPKYLKSLHSGFFI